MSPRVPLAGLLVLVLSAAPVALAQRDAWDAVEGLSDEYGFPLPPAAGEAAQAASEGASTLLPALDAPARQEDPAPEDAPADEGSHGGSHEDDEEETPPAGEGGWTLGLGASDVSSRFVFERLPVRALTDVLPSVPLALPEVAPPAPAAPQASPGPSAGPAAPAETPLPVPEAAGPSLVVAALASAAAVAPVVASNGLPWDRLRRFGLFAFLYTRIAKDRLLDHGRREALLNAARDRPGATLSDLADAAAMPRNTATYHLNRLEREGLVTSARRGRARLYFAAGGEVRKAQADALAALRHDKGRALARAVGEAPGLDQQALCAKLGLAPSLVHWHADRLVTSGVISKEREGRHVRYHPGPAFSLVATVDGEPRRDPSGAMAC